MAEYAVNPMDFYTVTTTVDLTDAAIYNAVVWQITHMCQPDLMGDVYDAGEGNTGFRFAVRNRGLEDGRLNLLMEHLYGLGIGIEEGNTTFVKADLL